LGKLSIRRAQRFIGTKALTLERSGSHHPAAVFIAIAAETY
jgi:hypothetical protein